MVSWPNHLEARRTIDFLSCLEVELVEGVRSFGEFSSVGLRTPLQITGTFPSCLIPNASSMIGKEANAKSKNAGKRLIPSPLQSSDDCWKGSGEKQDDLCPDLGCPIQMFWPTVLYSHRTYMPEGLDFRSMRLGVYSKMCVSLPLLALPCRKYHEHCSINI